MICPNWLKNRMTKTPDKKVKKHCIIQLSGEKKDNINYTTMFYGHVGMISFLMLSENTVLQDLHINSHNQGHSGVMTFFFRHIFNQLFN